MGGRLVLCLVAAAACAKGAGIDPDGGPDDGCTPQTYFADQDEDGHGDAAAPVVTCVQPPKTVLISDDCDDADPERAPGLPEACDAKDNDCDGATTEQCPAGCTAQRRPAPDDGVPYLFCTTGTSWVNAQAICTAAGLALAQLDDAAENGYVRATATSLLGNVDVWIGGSDRVTEATWVWPSGVAFWQGGSGGAPVDGRFANWTGGEPNDDGTEDCAELKPGGVWNDSNCGDAQRFVCRR